MGELAPPIEPMLARLTRALPVGEQWRYEPKWDGFRCLVFRSGAEVDLRSRNQRELGRYFPEIVAAVRMLKPEQFVLDGELVISGDGRSDFAALMSRLHPAASRVETLSRATPAQLIAFDMLSIDDTALIDEPFSIRRRALEETTR